MEISMMAIGNSHRTLVLLGFVVYTHKCRKCYISVGMSENKNVTFFQSVFTDPWMLSAVIWCLHTRWRWHVQFKTITDSGGTEPSESYGLGAALTPLFNAIETTHRHWEVLWVLDELFLESHDLYLKWPWRLWQKHEQGVLIKGLLFPLWEWLICLWS